MTKRLIKQGDDLVLVIDKSLQESLRITEKTELDVVVVGNILTIKPKGLMAADEKKSKKPKKQIQEFIDVDREVIDEYYEVMESNLSSKKMLQKMYQLIGEDKDFYDPYIIASELLLAEGKIKEGTQMVQEAYDRAIDRITDAHGNWPQKIQWGFLENRHIMRAIERHALFCWEAGKTDAALDIFRRLFRANPNDNQGARYSILALRLGLGAQEWQEPFEAKRNGKIVGLDAFKVVEWFEKNLKNFLKTSNGFLTLVSNNMFVLALLCLLTGCENPKSQPATLDQESTLCNLDESTHIIMHLLEKKALSTVLEPSDPEAIRRLIKNFSPAELALEAEGLNWPTPVVFLFIQKNTTDYDSMHMLINQAAIENNGTIKFIEVDPDELFKIFNSFDIEALPALLLMDKRAEVTRVEGVVKESFKADIQKLLETVSHINSQLK